VGVRWLWTTPLAPIPSKAQIGKLNLEQAGAKLQINFVPPKRLSSVTILFPKTMTGSENYSSKPEFSLSLRLRLSDATGTNIVDELVEKDRMQWTSWHPGPSLLLAIQGWLGDRLQADRNYALTVSVESPVAGLGEAEIYLHWMDGGYVWGRETQKLVFSTLSTE